MPTNIVTTDIGVDRTHFWISDTSNVYSRSQSLIEAVQGLLLPLVAQAYPVVSEVITSPEISPQCSTRLLTLMLGARSNQVWALRSEKRSYTCMKHLGKTSPDSLQNLPPLSILPVFTASGLISPNLFEGSLGSLGGYAQCVRTRNLEGNLRGSYCTTYFKVPRQLSAELERDFQPYGYMLVRFPFQNTNFRHELQAEDGESA